MRFDPTVTTATANLDYVYVYPPLVVVPRLCCLGWAVACVRMGGPFWFDDGPSLKGIYNSQLGESPCPRCDGYRHDNGFCGKCGRET